MQDGRTRDKVKMMIIVIRKGLTHSHPELRKRKKKNANAFNQHDKRIPKGHNST